MKTKIIVVSILLLLVAAFMFGCVKSPIIPLLKSELGTPEIEKGVFVHYPQGWGSYEKPPNAPEPTDEFKRYKDTRIHWATASVGYSVDVTDAPSGALAAIQATFEAWENDPAALWGITDPIEIDFYLTLGSDNTVSWGDTSDYPGAIAVTSITYWFPSMELIEVDTVMNSDFDWSATGESDKYDVQNIMTHEAGHWLVLDDLYQWKTQKLTMYGFSDLGEIDKQNLGHGDALGIDRIY